METCTFCQKDGVDPSKYEFYTGRTVNQFTTNWNSSAIYMTDTVKSYAINESPITGYLCKSCIMKHTLKTHITNSLMWIAVMAVPWLMLYLISKHVDTNQTAYVVFYVCLLLVLSQIIATVVSFGLQPREALGKIFGPFSVLFTKQGLEKYGDMLLSELKSDLVPPDVDVILPRSSYYKLNNYY